MTADLHLRYLADDIVWDPSVLTIVNDRVQGSCRKLDRGWASALGGFCSNPIIIVSGFLPWV